MAPLALLLQSGMSNQQGQQAFAAVAGMMGVFLFIGLAFMAFIIFLLWRIFTKAGMAGPLALIVLFPGIGSLIALCILAFGEWKVVPAPQAFAYPPSYPPPPAYPPQAPPAV